MSAETRRLGAVLPQMPKPPASDGPSLLAELVNKIRDARENVALKVACPWCHAQPGRWCEKWQGGAKPGKRAATGFLHPSRCESAGVEFVPDVPERGAA